VFSDKYPPEEEKVVGLEIVESSPVEIKFGFSESPCHLFKDEDTQSFPFPKSYLKHRRQRQSRWGK
jgi:hypothetical protein